LTQAVTSVTIGVPVGDLPLATDWYRRLFEPEDAFDPAEGVRELEIFPGCWLQLLEDDRGGGAWVLRYGVRDIEAERRRLVDLEFDVGPVERLEGVVATVDLRDPFGNRLSAYQVLSADP
jgi:hypothetical protein